tara:strand:- start:5241 stop:5852 length:612 start_codon:yes stop_codon:yes gene_type:complete
MIKKAAMFGLDARIALAIFGALSVISGAALYSAIQGAKVTAIITELNEISKAHEAYYLDTGSPLGLWSTSLHTTSIKDLISNISSRANWQGPYLPYSTTVDYVLKHSIYDNIIIYRIDDDTGTWGGTEGTDFVSYGGCTAGSTSSCNYYTVMEFIPKAIADAIDKQVDGALNYKSGNVKVRYYPTGAQAGKATVFIKHMAIKV